jgi:catechol 2,3-dioxygenase-like lactoylglutathione lyase family enzyme
MPDGSYFNGIESLDHPVIASRDLDDARVTYARLGFTIAPRGTHIEWGTGNLCIMFPDDYVEIRGIVDPARFTMNLDQHLDQYGEGLMGVAFRTDDVESSYSEMVDHGIQVAEPRRLTRNMHVVVLQHLTPELIRRPDFLKHPNTCIGVNSIVGMIDDAGRVAAKLALLIGEDSVTKDNNGVRLNMPTGQYIDLLLPHAYRTRFGSLPASPRLGAMTLRVADLSRAKAILIGNGVRFDEVDDGRVRIGPDDACGVILEFTEDSES